MIDVFKSYGMQGQGPGGMKCRCCGPAPGHEKHIMRRQARARLKESDYREFRHYPNFVDWTKLGRPVENWHRS